MANEPPFNSATCGRCDHAWADHMPYVGCQVDGCPCVPPTADEPPSNSRRVVLAVAFTVRTGPLSVLDADTDRAMAKVLTDYLNADEVNGLPMFVVPASFVVVAADEHGAYPVPESGAT